MALNFVDAGKLDILLSEGQEQFNSAHPFPHVIVDQFLVAEAAEAVLREFEATSEGWIFLYHFNENKRQLTQSSYFGPLTRQLFEELQSEEFTGLLGRLTGINNLIPDPDLDGSGLQEIKRGGFLNIHIDFLAHTMREKWRRQLNMLIYLNKEWKDSYKGHLEFWDRHVTKCEKKILPIFNRCVIFQTSNISYHGHPARLDCPPDRSRKSIALYYYKDEGKVVSLSSTHYRPIPSDPLGKRLLIYSDRFLLRIYSVLKRHTRLRDDFASRIMKLFSKS